MARARSINPWLRLLLALLAVVVGALLLQVLPALVVLVMFVVGTIWAGYAIKGRAKRELAESHLRVLGLEQSESDPFGLLGYPFALFSRGSDPGVAKVLHGVRRRLDVKAFEYSCVGLGEQRMSFWCVVVPLGATVPHLVVEPESFVTMLADRVALAGIESGSGEFDRRFEVRCDDGPFANAFFDSGMTTWLLDLDERWGFEVNGALALAYSPAPTDLETVLEIGQELVDHVPAKALSMYPTPLVAQQPDHTDEEAGPPAD